MEGTIGGGKGTLTGTIAVRGDDFSMSMVRTFGGEPTGVRQVVVGGWSYVRFKDQAWQLVPQDEAHPRPASLRSALMTVGCTEPEPGTLVMTGDDAVTVVQALGMVDPGTTDIGARATMTLRQDGNPDRLRIGYDSAVGRWDVTYAFDASATVEPLTVPADPVAVWEQSDAFQFLYPVNWQVNSIGEAPEILDLFASPNGVVMVWCEPTRLSFKGWVADGIRHYTEYWAAKPTDSWVDTIGTNAWSFADWEKATFEGEHGTAMVAATVNDGLGCDVTVFVFASRDRETLLQAFGRVLASFTFLN